MERPILFSTPMVQAILEYIKRMTRRVIKIKFLPGFNPTWTGYKPVFEYGVFFLAGSNGEPATKPVKCPFGKPGDILWVQETWKVDSIDSNNERNLNMAIDFKALENGYSHAEIICKFSRERFIKFRKFYQKNGWQSPYFMPREACRIRLKITDIRVERLQEITEEDARAEGCPNEIPCSAWTGVHANPGLLSMICTYKEAFQRLWDNINGSGAWDTNPYVWVIKFERITP